MRFVSWNVWGRYGTWEQRRAGIEQTLVDAEPDIVCLVESWATPGDRRVDRIAQRIGMEHRLFVGDWDQQEWTSGIGVSMLTGCTNTPERPHLPAPPPPRPGQ